MPNNNTPARVVESGFAVLILAAGQSQRLGQPKQLLTKNGKPLLLHFLELALSVKPERVIVVINQNLAGFSQSLSQSLNFFNIEFIINPQAHTGMASSLQTGACALKHYHGFILLLTVDQICLSKAMLAQFIQASQQYPQQQIVSAYAHTIGIPAMLQPELLMASRHLSADQGLKALLLSIDQQTIEQQIIKLNMPQLAFDIDTGEDLNHAIGQGWVDAPASH